MCASCGCNAVEDKHGDDRNITWSDVTAAAQAAGISPGEAAQNIKEAANVEIITERRTG